MAYKEEEIDSIYKIGCVRQAECFSDGNVPNAAVEIWSTYDFNANCTPQIRTMVHNVNNAVYSTRSKQIEFIIKGSSIKTSCRPREKISVATSSSSIGSNVNFDAAIVGKIKRETANAATSTTRIDTAFDQMRCKNLSYVVEDFVHGAPLRHAESTALCIGTGEARKDIVEREFSSETSLDVFTRAFGKKRRTDLILEKIVKISGACILKANFATQAKSKETDVCPRELVTSTADEAEVKIFKSVKPVSSIVRMEEKPSVITADVTQQDSQMLAEKQLSPFSTLLSQKSQDSSVFFDATEAPHDVLKVQVILPEKIRTDEIAPTKEPDVEITPVLADEKEQRVEKPSKKVRRRRMVSKDVSVIDKTVDAAVGSSIIHSVREPSEPCQSENIQTDVDSCIEILPEKLAQILKSAQPKCARSKYRGIDVCSSDEKRMARPKRTQSVKSAKTSTCTFSSHISCETTRRFPKWCEESAVTIDSYDRCRPISKVPQPIRYYEDLIMPDSSTHLEDPQHCYTSCYNLHNKAARYATLSRVCCPFLQDSYITKYRSNFPRYSPITNSAFHRNCTIDDCAKRRTTYGNLSHAHTHCHNGIKYCYTYLNDIDSARMAYCHCNDSSPVWSDDRHCGRSQSHYWTDGNLYFTHPWISGHLHQYNGY